MTQATRTVADLEAERARLSLDVAEGRGDVRVLEATEAELAAMKLANERAQAAELARVQREQEDAERRQQEERDKKAAALQKLARHRLKLAKEIEEKTETLLPLLEDFITTGEEAHGLARDLGHGGNWFGKVDPLIGYLNWRIGQVRRLRLHLDHTHETYRVPLSAMEKSWAPELATEESNTDGK